MAITMLFLPGLVGLWSLRKKTFNLCLTLHNFRKWSSLIAVWISFSYISINYPCSKFIKIIIFLCFLFSDSFTTLRASCSYSKVYATFLIWKWIIIQFSLTSSSYVSVRSYNVIPSGIFICLVSFLYKKDTYRKAWTTFLLWTA